MKSLATGNTQPSLNATMQTSLRPEYSDLMSVRSVTNVHSKSESGFHGSNILTEKKEVEYKIKADGACLLRGYLAAITKDMDWLEIKSLEEVYEWVNKNETEFLNIINDAFKYSSEMYPDIFKIEGVDSFLENKDLAEFYLAFMMRTNELALWRVEESMEFFEDYVDIKITAEIAVNLIDAIYEGMIHHFEMPMDPNESVYLERSTLNDDASSEMIASLTGFTDYLNNASHYSLISKERYFGEEEKTNEKWEGSGFNVKSEPVLGNDEVSKFTVKTDNKKSSLYRSYLALVCDDGQWMSSDLSTDKDIANYLSGKDEAESEHDLGDNLNIKFEFKLLKAFENTFNNIGLIPPSVGILDLIVKSVLTNYFPKGQYDYHEILSDLRKSNFLGYSDSVWKTVASKLESELIKELGFHLYLEEELSNGIKVNKGEVEYFLKDRNGLTHLVALKNHFYDLPTERTSLVTREQAIIAGIQLFTDTVGFFHKHVTYIPKAVPEIKRIGFSENTSEDPKEKTYWMQRDILIKHRDCEQEYCEGEKEKSPTSSQEDNVAPRWCDRNNLDENKKGTCPGFFPVENVASTCSDRDNREENKKETCPALFPQPKVAPTRCDRDNPEEKEKEKEKEKGSTFFPMANAAPIWHDRDHPKENEMEKEYNEWTENEAENKKRKRVKRRIQGNIDTPSYLLDFSADKINFNIDPKEMDALKEVVKKQTSKWKSSKNPAFSRTEAIRGELLGKSTEVTNYFYDSLDSIQQHLLRHNPAYRNGYDLYWARNELSVRDRGMFYFSKEAESFISNGDSFEQFQSLSHTRDMYKNKVLRLYANVMHKITSGEEIDYHAFGMLSSHLDIEEFNAGSSIRIKDWNTVLLNKKRFTHVNKVESENIKTYLRTNNYNENSFSPMKLDQLGFLSRATSLAKYNLGFCSYVSISTLLDMKDSSIAGFEEARINHNFINSLMEMKPSLLSVVTNGLNEANDDLQFAYKKMITENPAKIETGFQSMIDKIMISDFGHQIAIRFSDIGGGHAIGVGKVNIDGKRYPVLIDANLGVIPCYTRDELEHNLKHSIGILTNFDDTLNEFPNAHYKTIEMNEKNTAKFQGLISDDGYQYGLLTEKNFGQIKNPPAYIDDPVWSRYFNDDSKGGLKRAGSVMSLQYNPDDPIKPIIPADDLDEVFSKAIKNYMQMTQDEKSLLLIGEKLDLIEMDSDVFNTGAEEEAEKLHLSEKSKLNKAMSNFVAFLDDKASIVTDVVKRKFEFKTTSLDDLSDSKRLTLQLKGKLDSSDPKQIGSSIFDALLLSQETEAETMRGSVSEPNILESVIEKRRTKKTSSSLDNLLDGMDANKKTVSDLTLDLTKKGQSNAKMNVESKTKTSSDVDDPLIFRRMGMTEEQIRSIKGLNKNVRPPMIPSNLLENFLNEELSSISEFDLRQIELENQKIAQQLQDVTITISDEIRKTGRNPSDYEIAKKGSVLENYLLIQKKGSQDNNIQIMLPKNIIKSYNKIVLKTTEIFSRFNAAINSPDTLDIRMKAKKGWKRLGKGFQIGGSVMSIYTLQSLIKETSNFSEMNKVVKANLIINIIDLSIDSVANSIGTLNWSVKTFLSPVSNLSQASRISNAVSMGTSLIFNLVELGLHSYSYDHAETDMEREIAGIMVGCAVARATLSIVSIAVCNSFPLAAPAFAIVGFLISYIQNVVISKKIAQHLADNTFTEFEKELEEILKLLEDQNNYLYNEEDKNMYIVSDKMPYLKLRVDANGIYMKRSTDPFEMELIKTVEEEVAEYKIPIFAEPATWNTYRTWDNAKPEHKEFKEIFLKMGHSDLGSGFRFGYGPEYPEVHLSGIEKAAKVNALKRRYSVNNPLNKYDFKKTTKTISQKTEKIKNLDQCLSDKDTPKQVNIVFKQNENVKHVVISGKPVKPIYLVDKCSKSSYNGYSYEPRNVPLITKLDTCQERNENKGRYDQKYWKIKNKNQVINDIYEAQTKVDYYKGKYAYREVWECGIFAGKVFTFESCWEWRLASREDECFSAPTGIRLETQNVEYTLESDPKDNIIYHFRPGDAVNKLQNTDLYNRYSHSFAQNSSLPISNLPSHEERETLGIFEIKLASNGAFNFILYPGTKLRFSEQLYTYSQPDKKGNINLFLNFEMLTANPPLNRSNYLSVTNSKIASKSGNSKNIIIDRDSIEEIEIIRSDDCERELYFQIDKTIEKGKGGNNELRTALSIDVEYKSDVSHPFDAVLNLNNMSVFPLTSVEETTSEIKNEIMEIKKTLQNMGTKGFNINRFRLESDYHKSFLTNEITDTNVLFESSGWYFIKDENIEAHPTVKKHGGMVVSKVWRKDTPEDKKEIFRRMQFVGFTHVGHKDIPPEIAPHFNPDEPAFAYHFYDENAKTLVKQYGDTEIRHWDPADVRVCPENSTPQKIRWGDAETENYSCNAVHIAPQAQSAALTSGRVHVLVDLEHNIKELKGYTNNDGKNIFNLIEKKATQTVKKEFGISDAENIKETQEIPLFIEMINPSKEQTYKYVLVNECGLKLAVIPVDENIIAIPNENDYVLTVREKTKDEVNALKKYLKTQEVAGKNKNTEKEENATDKYLAINARPLIQGHDLENVSSFLLENTSESEFINTLPKAMPLLNNIAVKSIRNIPDKNMFICTSHDGVTFSISHDRKTKRLYAVDDEYLSNNDVNASSPLQVANEFRFLELIYGSSAFDYFKIKEGEYNEEGQNDAKSIYVSKHTEKVIYIPSYIEKNGNITELSKEHVIILEDLKSGEMNGKVTLQDITNRCILEVRDAYSSKSSQVSSFYYQYLSKGEDDIYLSLLSISNSTEAQENEILPFFGAVNLNLMPCLLGEGQKVPVLEISPLSQRQLQTITLVAPASEEYATQIISVNTGNSTTSVTARALIFDYGRGSKLLTLVLPTSQEIDGMPVSSSPLYINLNEAMTNGTASTRMFENSIILNGQALNLTELIQNATRIDMTRLESIQEEDEEEETQEHTKTQINFDGAVEDEDSKTTKKPTINFS